MRGVRYATVEFQICDYESLKVLWESALSSIAANMMMEEIELCDFFKEKDTKKKNNMSHTSKPTAGYLAKKESETEIKCILFYEIPVKPPDDSSMDFCAFGSLK
ncbi:hypothetical protein TNCV_404321 [Trichonephila clavipes]|nr:hypothetical protein TNCV_404321 [Trichonephila clavipes]